MIALMLPGVEQPMQAKKALFTALFLVGLACSAAQALDIMLPTVYEKGIDVTNCGRGRRPLAVDRSRVHRSDTRYHATTACWVFLRLTAPLVS